MSFEIEGEYNTATVKTSKSKNDAEEASLDQMQTMADHESCYGDSDIVIMPDHHFGKGAVIGFTMPVKDRIVPNLVGVDCGCGMYAVNVGKTLLGMVGDEVLEEIDQRIRSKVPLGFDVHDRSDYHMHNDFPWSLCQQKLNSFVKNTDFESIDVQYSGEYFNDLCNRVGYDTTRAINSVGSLGGGNHFIEIGEGSSGNTWVIVHTGSRGIGAEIANYWQEKAHEATFQRNADVEIPKSEWKYLDAPGHGIKLDEGDEYVVVKAGDIEINREAILEDYDGQAIEGKFGQLKQYMNAGKDDKSDLDYLEGEEAHGYITDMIFAQTYASQSRRKIAKAVADAIGGVHKDSIESVHNYIDFNDGVIRKGACRAHEGERLIIPFNIEYGTLICEGLGSEEWNNSAPHGAGRQMSRTGAKSQFSDEDFTAQTEGVYTSSRPIDEIPGAYKPPEEIESAIGETATVVDRVKPVLNIKDD